MGITEMKTLLIHDYRKTAPPTAFPTGSPTRLPTLSPTPVPTASHPCDDGSHTCDKTNGFCVKSGISFVCQCNSGFVCQSGCTTPFAGHLCTFTPSPTKNPTFSPTPAPTDVPTTSPTFAPTNAPTEEPRCTVYTNQGGYQDGGASVLPVAFGQTTGAWHPYTNHAECVATNPLITGGDLVKPCGYGYTCLTVGSSNLRSAPCIFCVLEDGLDSFGKKKFQRVCSELTGPSGSDSKTTYEQLLGFTCYSSYADYELSSYYTDERAGLNRRLMSLEEAIAYSDNGGEEAVNIPAAEADSTRNLQSVQSGIATTNIALRATSYEQMVRLKEEMSAEFQTVESQKRLIDELKIQLTKVNPSWATVRM